LCDIGKARRAPFFLIVAVASAIPFLCTGNAAPWWATSDLTTGNVQATIGTYSRVTAPVNSVQTAGDLAVASSPVSFADMDKMSGVKGWNIGFPSFGDTLTMDYGGWRSTLASAGIGLIEYNSTRFQANVLDTPREGPQFNPIYESAQNYWGQKPSFANFSVMVLTYDLSRFGVPDGQLQFAGINTYATFQSYIPDALTMLFLAY
jgi:porin